MVKNLIAISFILCLTLFYGTQGNCQRDDFPPDSRYTQVSIPDLKRPNYLESIKDPVFGTQIVRITDSLAFGKNNVRHHYSKDQPWNCDQTLILMEKWILDGTSYRIIRKMDIPEEPRWSHKNPKKIFGVKENSFVSFNALTGESQILYTFLEYDKILIGPWEGNLSADDRYVAFQGDISGEWHVLVFDILNNKLLVSRPAKDLGPFPSFDWVSISPSGEYVVINWRQRNSKLGGIITYDRNLNKVAELFSRGEHGDLGYDADGNEVYVQVCPFKFARLDNGEQTSFFTNACGHMSLRNYKRPGWCYVSVGTGNTDVLAIKLDKSGVVERFTHHRSKRTNYNAEAHAVASPDGKKVMFVSNWLGTSEINSYVVSLIDGEMSTDETVSPEVVDRGQNSEPRLPSPYVVPPATMYVSPGGSDNNDGRSINTPFKTITKAAATVQPGDVVYMRGGVYPIKVNFSTSGTSSQKIVWTSYPGEWAILDGSDIPKSPSSKDFPTVYANHNVFANFTTRHGPYRGFIVFGSDNLITGLVSHGHNFSGIQNYNGNNNIYEWCVAYDNYDIVPISRNPAKAGNNADGIGISSGNGNIVRRNLVYHNSDDGIDVWEGNNSLVEYNVAYNNGYGPEGNGNGFKGGGPSGGNNVFKNNVAFHNKMRGFTDNNGSDVSFINNTAFNNNRGDRIGTDNYGASFQATQSAGNVFKNNLTILGAGNTVDITSSSTQEHNSWNLDITAPQFKSTDPNNSDFLRLSTGSPAIGAGVGGVNLGSDESTIDLLHLARRGKLSPANNSPVITVNSSSPTSTIALPVNQVSVSATATADGLPSVNNGLGPQKVLRTAPGAGQRNLFVSPTGSGSNCSQAIPCSIRTGISQSKAGDVVFLRGGQYDLPVGSILFNQSGTQSHPIVYESYPGELAIFDGSSHAKGTNVGIRITGSWIELRRIEVRNMPRTGLYTKANHNLMDGIHSHHNSGTGIHIFSDYDAYPYGAEGSYNTIKNSIIHDNSDAGLTYAADDWGNNGGDADGISISSGDSNRALNNLVYHNSDDGVDSWRSTNTEFAYNIIHSNGIANGNGNGIKAGGSNQSFNTYVHHNISYNNRSTGIDFNSGVDVMFYNNVSYNNHTGYTLGKTTKSVNNIEFSNKGPSYRSGNHDHNSWNLPGYTVSANDFLSLDPNSPNFLRLTPESGLRNAGSDVGFPFNGTAPDLGVYEQY